MPSTIELSLKQLGQIALGAPELTTVNISILHSLIDLILKKLNCQDEKVTISGFEAKCLEKILQNSKISPVAFNDELMVPITEKLDKVEVLEQRFEALNQQLEDHLEMIRKCNKSQDHTLHHKFWEHYASPCEDLCTTCDPSNETACSLLQNMDFLQKLMRLIAAPVVDRVFQLQDKIESFYIEFKKFVKELEEVYQKIEIVKQCVIEIEALREMVEKQNLLFLGTMEELQDMLDSKLDKVHMPALKKYIRDRFDNNEARLIKLETKSSCPRVAGFINKGLQCISCGNTNVGADVSPNTMRLLADAIPAKQNAHNLHCGKTAACRPEDRIPPLKVRMHNLDLDLLSTRLNKNYSAKIIKLPDANDKVYGLK